MTEPRKLRVFLCHSSQDKPVVRALYEKLLAEGWVDPWLDEEKLLPGHDWDMEIEKAVESTDAVIVFLSSGSVSKEGYVQKELRKVLDIALEKTEEAIFVIPLRLDNCEMPRRLRSRHYVDYFPAAKEGQAYQRLLQALNVRFQQLNPDRAEAKIHTPSQPKADAPSRELISAQGSANIDLIGSIPLILYFALAALYVLTPSDSTIQLAGGIVAVLAGLFFILRRQIPSAILFKVSTILFLAVHTWNYMTDLSLGRTTEGIVALAACGAALLTIRAPRKRMVVSSLSLAALFFLLGVRGILYSLGIYPDFFSTLVPVVVVIAVLILVMDL